MPETNKQRHDGILDYPAIVLCGGRSRRMGQDKAFLPLGTQTILQRVENAFFELSDHVTLVIGQQAVEPSSHHFSKVVRDEHLDFGPLEGLRVGLQSVSENSDLAMVGTCDAPLVVGTVYREMARMMHENPQVDAVLPLVDGRHYPLTAVYRLRVLQEISAMVARKQLRVRELLSVIHVMELDEATLRQMDPKLNTIRNVNTREEYEALVSELSEPENEQHLG